MESGNNSDMGNYRDNRQRVFRGRVLSYVRSTGSGPVTLNVTSPLLKGAEITIRQQP